MRAIEPQARDRADRERAGFGRGAGDAGAGAPPCAGRSALAPETPVVLYTGHVRGVPGARPAVRRDGDRARRRARTRGCCWPAASRIRSTRAARRGARRGHRATSRCSPANGRPRRFRRICWPPTCSSRRDRAARTRRSRSTSTCGPGKPIVATRLLTHTQVLSDDTAILTGATPRGVRRRHPRRALTDRERAAAVGTAARGAGRDRSTATRPISSGRAGPAPRWRHRRRRGRGREGRRVTRARDHYSYTIYADPDTARTFDARRFGGPIGELVAEHAGARARRACSARSRTVAILDVGTGTGRAALLLARGGAHVTGVDASERDAGRRAAARRDEGAAIRFRGRRCARARFPDRSFDVAVSLRVLMHTPRVAAMHRRAVPRRRAPGDRRLSVGAQRRGARVGRRGASRTRLGVADRAVSGLHRPRDRAPRFASARLPDSLGAPPVRPADRVPQGHRLARFTHRDRAAARRGWACSAVRLAGHARRRTVRVLVTGATGFTGGHLARALAAAATRCARWSAMRARGRTSTRPASSSRSATLRDPARRSDVARRRRRRRLSHRGDLPAGRAVATTTYRAVNATAVGRSSRRPPAAGVRRVVHCSTVGVHGDIEHPPANEDAPLKPGDIYQETKLEGERLAREAGRALGIEVTIVRPTGIYGPGDRRLLKLFRGVARRRCRCWAAARSIYHLTYIDDLVEGFRLCGEHPAAANRTYILAGGEVTTLNELVALVAEVAGVPPPTRASAGLAVLDGRRRVRSGVRAASASSRRSTAGGSISTPRAARSTSRARGTEIGYAPQVGLDATASRRTLDWYRATWLALTLDHRTHGSAPIGKAQEQLFAPGTSSREKYAALVVGRPGSRRAAEVRARRHAGAGACRGARPGAAQGALSAAARLLRPQRRLRAERRAAASAQDPHRRQRRHRRQLPARRQGRRPTAASGSATASSSAATRSCRARTATSSSADGANIGFNCEMFSASRVTIGPERADGRVQLRHRRRPRLLRSVEAGARRSRGRRRA